MHEFLKPPSCEDEECPANYRSGPDAYPTGIATLKNSFGDDIESAFASIGSVIKASNAPIPIYPDVPANDDLVKPTGILDDLHDIGFGDVRTLIQTIKNFATGAPVDDNKLLLERIIQLAAKLEPTSEAGADLSDAFITQLWNDLPHPPITSLGSKYRYRTADGSYNNIQSPDLGKAGQLYARSARPQVFQNIALPDPGLIFDSLLVRDEDKFEPHPNKISSQMFYLAIIIIHDIFITDSVDYNISLTSSYLDLSPLYGSTRDQQNSVRTFKNGKLKPDCFASKRILGFPPGVGVFVIMFNRFHNYVATQLSLINENGRFMMPAATSSKAAWEQYDDDLFQTARLITGGLYVNIILKDYVRTILSLNRTNSAWDLDPRIQAGQSILGKGAGEATGNQVSAEFNLIYRWHSAISQRDAKWTEEHYVELFPEGNPKDVNLPEFLTVLTKMEASLDPDPTKRPFANLTRKSDGSYADDVLVELLVAGIEDVAGAFGANTVPAIMRPIEMMGIIQARKWNLATLNEFRAFFNLTKHKTFEDINPDPVAAATLKNLYGHPDFVELYPGLVAEKAKPPMSPGSGLCANFTTSRAILSDAVALVRGDRFYTVDYTPKILTNWGFNEAQYDPTVDLGHVMSKLIFRAFPSHFTYNSIYAHFPFVIPSENLVIQKSLGKGGEGVYDWSKPARIPDVIPITSYVAVTTILSNKEQWRVIWGKGIEYLTSHDGTEYGQTFALSGDERANTSSRDNITKALYPSNWEEQIKQFYKIDTTQLLKQYSYKIAGVNQVDIVRDVINLVQTRFAAEVYALPLKTERNPKGVYTEQQLYTVLAVTFALIFYDVDISKSFSLHQAARTLTQQLGELVELNVTAVSDEGFLADILAKLRRATPTLSDYGTHMIQRLLESGNTIESLVWSNIIPTAAGSVANNAQLFAQTLDYYLGDGIKHLPELYRLSKLNTSEADETLLKYYMEGSRIAHTVGLYRQNIGPDRSYVCSDGTVRAVIPTNARIFCNIRSASLDPTVFPNPTEVDISRDPNLYIHYGWGPHMCLGRKASQVAAVEMLKVICGLKGLRRALGPMGVIKKVQVAAPGQRIGGPGGYVGYMTRDQSAYWPFPSSMLVQWDDDVEGQG